MIRSIDISNFGCFRDFNWSRRVRDKGNNVAHFKKLNIIYGRNYAGKTTVSRIVRGLQTGALPRRYEMPSFRVTTAIGDVTNEQLPLRDLEVRVYNKDFIKEHLSFLSDEHGEISPFAVLGSANRMIEEELSEKERILGSVEEGAGLRHKHSQLLNKLNQASDDHESAVGFLKKKLGKKANSPSVGIKHNPMYHQPNYNTPKIKADIKEVKALKLKPFEASVRRSKELVLEEKALPSIGKALTFRPALAELLKSASDLVSREITATQPIQELMEDPDLQQWVRSGIARHRGRSRCGFCGQVLPEDFWAKLERHFSSESEDLEAAIKDKIEEIEREKASAEGLLDLERVQIYSRFHGDFDEAKRVLSKEMDLYGATFGGIAKELRAKKDDIFTPRSMPSAPYETTGITAAIKVLNRLIQANDGATSTLAQDQDRVREQLRLSEVAEFVEEIDFDAEQERIAELRENQEKIQAEVDELERNVLELESAVESIRSQSKDERIGAEKVNEYLNNYFGHASLRLVAVEDELTSAFKFEIRRGNRPAYNLSEGECGLVGFCYFMAKLDDAESRGKKLTIFIDDPVSSLDSNHMFFVFSLIETLIARPREDADGERRLDAEGKQIFDYEQLFISTHSLEFMKFLKKLSRPKNDHEHFIVIGKEDGSTIEVMPEYLKNYVTEFNYLFGEIYKCANSDDPDADYHCFYNFGNNLRKFLEVFLFFKYPSVVRGSRAYSKRIERFFRDEPRAEPLVQRLTNEFSHLGGVSDRGFVPVDYAEIARLASFILKRIRQNDKEQFRCLLESVGQRDPFVQAS